MLRSLKELERYVVCASDGKVGRCVDFLLDTEHWIIRYLVVETGGFLSRHQVLITPKSVVEIERDEECLQLALTRKTVENSPDVDTQKPISRRHEAAVYDYYGYPQYWDYTEAGAGASPAVLVAESSARTQPPVAPAEGTIQIRSSKSIRGYELQATDGSLGHVDDFIVQDDIWEVRYIILDTSKWWTGAKVLVAPEWAAQISWAERTVRLRVSLDAVKSSPEWDPNVALDREYETRLHKHYGLPSYWGNREVKDMPVRPANAADESALIERQRHQHE